MKTKIILSITSILSLTTSLHAGAALTLDSNKFKLGATEGGAIEFDKGDACIIPQKYSLTEKNNYSTQDEKREKKLCKIDLNANALCPKLNSTNPGTLIIDPKDVPPGTVMTNSACKAKSFGVDAKFKQSITCSYAPSALAAYHLSRVLGNQLITPVAVARSMDSERHSAIIDQALSILTGRNSEIIYKSWDMFKTRNSKKHGSESEPKLYLSSSHGPLLYGALSENLKRESIYTEVSGVGPYDTRYQRFTQQAPYKRVTDDKDVESIIGKNITDLIALPALQQMIDVSNMIVLDTLLNQDDRIGNIHFYLSYATLNTDGTYSMEPLDKESLFHVSGLNKQYKSLSRWREQDITNATGAYIKYKQTQLAKKSPEEAKAFNTQGILLRQMVLKDNDCGVDVDKRSNNMRGISAIESLRHISPTTYLNILRLQKAVNNGTELKDFFLNTLLYRAKDFAGGRKTFVDNLNKVADTIKANCKNNSLKIDLGVQKLTSCDL